MFSRPVALCALILYGVCGLAFPHPALAAASVTLSGTVTFEGKPVANADVYAVGDNVTAHTQTTPQGRFAFTNLTPGTYAVRVAAASGSAYLIVDLGVTGADLPVALKTKQLAVVSAIAESSPVRRAGTDVTLNNQQLTRSPAAGSFPSMLVQLPGAARGANGVVHINGDHGDINYIVDGVSIPQELNRNIGTEFNSDDIAFVDVLEGAYPAQYGERFASVLNIDTRSGAGSRAYEGSIDAGSFGALDSSFGYQGPVGPGSIVTAFRNSMTNRGLDPPNPASPHDGSSDANQFVRITLPRGANFLNVTLSHAYQTYQLPVDVVGGQPPSSDDNETQDDSFLAIQERDAIGDRGASSYALGFKRSHIGDFGDPATDWTYGEALNAAAGGLATDCANALSIANFTTTTCAFSLHSDRTAYDEKLNEDVTLGDGSHSIGWGGLYDAAQVSKLYDVALQPGNFLSPIFTPSTPSAPYTVSDDAPNVGHTEAVYLEDAWHMGSFFELDYGLRGDAFQLRSNQFTRGFSQVSPRVKLTRIISDRSSVYAYFGRFFTPFSFENVSPTAAQLLNLPLQRGVAAFDLKPQRDSDYELGGHIPLGPGDLGLRVMQKDATDLIDDTQVGVTLLHQDINYALGRIATQSIYYQRPLVGQGRLYFSVNHTYSVNKGCETQLLAPCFGSPDDWTPADHEQRWGSTIGGLFNDARGGWFSVDGEYGSGLSSAACPTTTVGFCKYTPHTTFDVEHGMPFGSDAKLTLRIRNLLNDRYRITYLNAQGDHWYAGRSFDAELSFNAL
ncbi:MAG TPA: carboxypeptidase regulatory-like domain-containing protein [Candidatus Eremiobacteraceae bacterium]|nr:carboxypeptidase regulatory-like domain-containing protein [Candidatus Eremiobacteraceae bacterium]